MSQKIAFREIWCTKCECPQIHEIIYKGTKQKKSGVFVKFTSDCQRCKQRLEEGQIKSYIVNYSVIPIKDYNSLIQRVLYDHKK